MASLGWLAGTGQYGYPLTDLQTTAMLGIMRTPKLFGHCLYTTYCHLFIDFSPGFRNPLGKDYP